MKTHFKILPLILSAFFLAPVLASAQATGTFEVSGWIPYWRTQAGVQSILPHLADFTEVNPFFYSVRQDGTLFSNGSLSDPAWVAVRAAAKAQGVRFIPTVMWANADAIDATLENPTRRQEHIRAITAEIYAQNLDGIDIDYEGKYARTRPYFSLFLKELTEAIGFNKWVMCTIEARTPLDSRYESPESIPKDIEYANDFAEINKYCDRVRIMAYDQRRIDLKLNAANTDPYVPVADRAWVEKVIRLAAAEIDARKLVIGVPTYGHEYDMFSAGSGTTTMEYSQLWSLNPGYATTTAATVGQVPARNSGGELSFTYPASQSPDGIVPLPAATRVVVWSDAMAIEEKAALAVTLGVRGISIFKIDGGQDEGLWGVLQKFPGTKALAKQPNLASGDALPTQEEPAESKPFVFTRDLEFGMRGEDVRALQVTLNTGRFTVAQTDAGSPGQETSYFGPATRAALVRFQQAHNIKPAVGYFGPITRGVFQSL